LLCGSSQDEEERQWAAEEKLVAQALRQAVSALRAWAPVFVFVCEGRAQRGGKHGGGRAARDREAEKHKGRKGENSSGPSKEGGPLLVAPAQR